MSLSFYKGICAQIVNYWDCVLDINNDKSLGLGREDSHALS